MVPRYYRCLLLRTEIKLDRRLEKVGGNDYADDGDGMNDRTTKQILHFTHLKEQDTRRTPAWCDETCFFHERDTVTDFEQDLSALYMLPKHLRCLLSSRYYRIISDAARHFICLIRA